ncbi:MAG: hypothetical protein IPN67_14720 [Bacteroidales bacterium]|nr:hypothetical protein [Bacteroidales bacterium]MBK8883585.1 hypothetical protein [Bacteroidales bacterium]
MHIIRKYPEYLRPILFTAFIILSGTANSQDLPEKDTILIVEPGAYIQIRDSLSFFTNDTLLRLSTPIIQASNAKKDKNLLYFDSIKLKTSKKSFTKKLYDLVVISPPQVETKKIIVTSDENYIRYSGKTIRHIEIIRMDVFGTNINNPAAINNKTFNNLLNNTHVNTNERIIRKNMLFSAGDTVSPLTLSDNERIIRELPFIDDARIIVVPVSVDEADIIVLTKDVYSLGADYDYGGIKKGSLSVFEKNILGTGHEFGIQIPFNSEKPNSPGFGGNYKINNLWKSFINLNVDYLSGLGSTSYGISLSRNFVSAATKYAGGILVMQMYTTTDLDTMPKPVPLKYNLQDYWIARSFLINRESVSRIIIGARYLNNNVFRKPEIQPETYYSLQRYQLYVASVALSVQKYYKTNLIYGYGRTEDIPYGGLIRLTAGREFNEFKTRTYLGADFSAGKSFPDIGYFYTSLALTGYFKDGSTEQGISYTRLNYFTNLLPIGKFKSRNFVTLDYSRGIGRYSDEHLRFIESNGFTGFRNDSINGSSRFTLSLESVLFSPANYHGFRFAFFGFSDLGMLSNSNTTIDKRFTLLSLGIGLRVRNDNLLFNTLQIRLAFFPNPPMYSQINNLTISGEQLLKPNNFNAGKPLIIPYR